MAENDDTIDDVSGGFTSSVQANDREHEPAADPGFMEEPSKNITAQPKGAKRNGYFRERDYE